MDTATRQQIVLAAVAITPNTGEDPGGLSWPQQVAANATRITALLGERSEPMAAIAHMEACKVFCAEIVGVTKEQSSTRALVELATRPSDRHPDGIETARSPRTDRADGLALARQLTRLRGRRVKLWVEVESIGGDRTVRVIRHVEPLDTEEVTMRPAS